MNNLMLNFNKCCDVATMVRKHCYNNLSKTEFEFPYATGRYFNFLIKLPSNSQVHSISVSIVPFLNDNLKTDDIDLTFSLHFDVNLHHEFFLNLNFRLRKIKFKNLETRG